MDPRLLEVCREGNSVGLDQLLEENPDILEDVAVMTAETPLHIASKLGHLQIVSKILIEKPEFAVELNQDGYTPLHLASSRGHWEIVRRLVAIVGQHLCLQTDKYGRTPLHCATMKGRIGVMNELLSACPQLNIECNSRGEIPLHFAVLYNQHDAFKLLALWLKRTNKENFINTKDNAGNTVLHLATSRKQLQVIKMMVGKDSSNSVLGEHVMGLTLSGISEVVEVNALNEGGFTALDILDVLPQSHGEKIDKEIESMLRQAGGLRARDMGMGAQQLFNTNQHEMLPHPDSLDLVSNITMNQLPIDEHKIVLLTAVLIAAITFLATFIIAGDSWQDHYDIVCINNTTSTPENQHSISEPIRIIPRHRLLHWFILFNTAGFFTSIAMIVRILYYLPFMPLSLISVSALLGSYVCTVIAISPDEVHNLLIIAIPVASLATASYILPHGILANFTTALCMLPRRICAMSKFFLRRYVYYLLYVASDNLSRRPEPLPLDMLEN